MFPQLSQRKTITRSRHWNRLISRLDSEHQTRRFGRQVLQSASVSAPTD